MCELLGMSANVPTDFCFSFKGLRERGGKTGPHKDGWGVAFYQGKGVASYKDPQPSYQSEIARLLTDHPIKTTALVAHIRQANSGGIGLENTHPFTRTLWGRYWTYAHNGQLQGFNELELGQHHVVGETDSEHAFCYLLHQLEMHFAEPPADMREAFEFIAGLCPGLQQLGVFNLLLSDGHYLLAYCSTKLHWITRRAPFGQARLSDVDLNIDFANETTANDVVTVIATMPLTCNEQWQAMQSGQWQLFCQGEPV